MRRLVLANTVKQKKNVANVVGGFAKNKGADQPTHPRISYA